MEQNRQVILFQGDSITDGNRSRNDDPNHFLGHGYAYIIAAQLGASLASGQPLFLNRGVSGDRASDLYGRWNEDALGLKPDILSILVGVNDVFRWMKGEGNKNVDRYASSYRHILEETVAALPNVKLVLCEPFILNTGIPAEDFQTWDKRMKEHQETVRILAEHFKAVHVPMQFLFDEAVKVAPAEYWLWDGIHPTAAGHDLLARQWLEVVQGQGLLKD